MSDNVATLADLRRFVSDRTSLEPDSFKLVFAGGIMKDIRAPCKCFGGERRTAWNFQSDRVWDQGRKRRHCYRFTWRTSRRNVSTDDFESKNGAVVHEYNHRRAQ